MKLKILQHPHNDTTTINGTKYANHLFESFGVTFSSMIGQVLRIDKREDGVITITRLKDLEEAKDEWESID